MAPQHACAEEQSEVRTDSRALSRPFQKGGRKGTCWSRRSAQQVDTWSQDLALTLSEDSLRSCPGLSCGTQKIRLQLKVNFALLLHFTKNGRSDSFWRLYVRMDCDSMSHFGHICVYLRVLKGDLREVAWRGEAFLQVHLLFSGIGAKDIFDRHSLFFVFLPSFTSRSASGTPEKLIDSQKKKGHPAASKRY